MRRKRALFCSDLGGLILGNHRSRLDIIADMLTAIGEKAKKTQIMYKASLNYGVLMKYLEELSRSCLIRFEADESNYVLTPKGLDFLDQYRNYLKRNKQVEKQISDVNGKREALEEMCSGN